MTVISSFEMNHAPRGFAQANMRTLPVLLVVLATILPLVHAFIPLNLAPALTKAGSPVSCRLGARSSQRAYLTRLRMSGSKKGDKKDDKSNDEEGFTVTWEHEDGSTDTTEAVKLVDKTDNSKKSQQGEEKPKPNPFQRAGMAIKNFFGGAKLDRQKLAALGGSALLSYGFISNISYTTCLIAAWVIFAKRTGLTPLDPGQWPQFLVVYGGFWMVQNFIRPARFALSVALTPYFDKFVEFVRAKTAAVSQRDINKPTAFGITVFIVNVLGSFTYMFLGLFLATLCAGVPLLPASMRGIAGPA